MEAKLLYHHSEIHYGLYGTGPLLLCMHGYNHNTGSFHFLIKRLQHRFTLLAIDMPYHGSTEWKEQRPFTTEDLHAILTQLHPEATKGLHLLGYSMGGRLAMAYFQQYPATVKSIALIAPDGFRMSPWYRMATGTKIGERLFHNTMHNPGWLYRYIQATDRMKIIKPGLGKAVMFFLQNKEGRMELYNRWTSLSTFRPVIRVIKTLLQKQKIPMHILFGKTDPVISYKDGIRFQKACPQQVHIKVIPAGHFLMNERYADDIIALLPEG